MINWYGVFANSLWVLGAAMLLAGVSWSFYARRLHGRSWLQQLSSAEMTMTLALGMMLISMGLGLRAGSPIWQAFVWLMLSLAFALVAWISYRQRLGRPVDLGGLLHKGMPGTHGVAMGLILLGVIMGTLYAVTIRPWMQPDEPRHYEVAMHNARLGRPGTTTKDLVPAWEQELIADMEAQSFWWYGYSVIGWDPNNLPKSFTEIWEPRYSRAFFQLPLYYDLAGLLLYAWGDELTLSQTVILLRLFGVFWLALSLGGIYAIGRELFPDHPQIALGALAFAALWPSHLAANAAVNNDPMAEALVIWTTFFAIRVLRRGPSFRTLTWFFILIILTIYTKRTGFSVLAFLGAIPLWGLLQVFRSRSRRAKMIGAGVLIGGMAALPLLFYIIQATGRYWVPESLMESLRTGALWQAFLEAPLGKFVETLYRTFWGWFGWLRVPLPDWMYLLGMIFTLGFLGLVVLGYIGMFSKRLAGWQRGGLFLLMLALSLQLALTLGKDVVYGDWKSGSVPQMRYLYPVLPTLLLPGFLGLYRIVPGVKRNWILPSVVIVLLFFNLYILGFILYPFFWL